MRWRRRTVGFLLVPAMFVSGGLAPAVSAVDEAVPQTAGDSSIEGRLQANGKPHRGWIRIRVWPDDEYLGRVPDGAQFEKLELADVQTDASGRFEFTVPADVPERFVADDGEVALEITGSDGYTAAIANLSVVLTGSENARPVEAGQLGTGPTRSLPRPRVTLDVGIERAAAQRRAAQADARRAGLPVGDTVATPVVMRADALGMGQSQIRGTHPHRSPTVAASDYWSCWSETGSRHGPYREQFATFYGKSYAKGRVVHNEGTRHTVGVAVKGPGGTWGQARTDAVNANGVGYDSGYTIVDAHVFNRIYQRYYYAKCRSMATGVVETTTTSKPAGFSDGPQYTYAGHVDYSNCTPGYAGHNYHRTSEANHTYGAGLDLPFVNLSSHSGWTSTTEMHWRFTRTGKLCGNGEYWGQAKRVSSR